jgi:hypothetical protein
LYAVRLVREELARKLDLAAGGQNPWPPTGAPTSPRSCQTGPCSLTNEITLKFGQCAKDVKYQFPTWSRRVNLFRKRCETDPTSLKVTNEDDEMRKRSPKSVKTPHDQSVALSQVINRA